MTVLVTGGAGFIGSHFTERLLADQTETRVICLDDFNAAYNPKLKHQNIERFSSNPRVKVVEGSICDAALLKKLFDAAQIRGVVHLAALAGVCASVANPAAYEDVNVVGTQTLLAAARAYTIERFLLVSSSTVYGPEAERPFREDAPLGTPLSPYGKTKRAAELAGLACYEKHGLPVACLRPISVYGPRMRPDLAMHVFATAIVESRPIPVLGDGSAERDFTHVSDICTGLLAALRAKGIDGQAINLGHNQPVALGEMIALLETSLGSKATIEYLPAAVGDMRFSCADLTKAEHLLGYRPRMSLADGVRDFAEWFLRSRSGDQRVAS